MSQHYQRELILLLSLSLLVTGALASDAPTITVLPADNTLDVGETTTIAVLLDTVPTGLSGFNITIALTNSSVGEFTKITFPAWAMMPKNGSLPADTVYAQAVDLERSIEPGATNVTLCTLTFRGDAAGKTNQTITPMKVDDDIGGRYAPTTAPASITVGIIPTPTPTTGLSFTPVMATITFGDVTGYAMVIDSVPTGLSGFNISVALTNPSIGEIVGISYPAWAMMPKNSSLPTDSVFVQAVDLERSIEPGATNVTLCALTIRGDVAGVTNLTITPIKVDDDLAGRYAPETTDAMLVVENLPAPVTNFTANVTAGTAPLAVQFTDTSAGDPTAWSWSFGDGATSNKQHPTHIYTAPGTYTVTLNASNAYGFSAETKTDHIIVLEPPEAAFTALPTEGNAPLAVQFTDQSTGNVTAWNWSFGDGNTSTDQNPTHTYATAGTYTVSLNASNAYRYSISTPAMITVLEPPTAAFTANVTEGNVPLAVRFTDQSTGNVTAWRWSFGDDTTSTEQSPIHTYRAPGTYTVSLNASNAGSSSTETKTDYITVIIPPPVAAFTTSVTEGNAPLTIRFTDTSTGEITAWLWSFGDGATATTRNSTHTYSEAGTYTARLTITGPGGNDVAERIITVTPPATGAAFTANITAGVAPLTVRFTDTSSNSPTTWLWTFGDSATSTEQHPVHTYTLPGNHTVTLSVDGGAEACTKPGYIKVTPILFGDATEDGEVNQADTLLVLQQVVGLREKHVAGTDEFQKTDVNQNGAIDVGDALFIAQYNVGLRDVWFGVL